MDDTFPVVFNQGGCVRAVTAFGTYNLVGGFNMQVPGDATHAYHLIRLKNGQFTYDGLYTRALSQPGGCVTAIGRLRR